MKTREIIDTLMQRKRGQFIKMSFKTEDKPRAEFKGTSLFKVVSGVFRWGINYSNMKEVKEAIESGMRGEVGSLPWGHWVPGYEHVLIKLNGVNEDKMFLRIYPSPIHPVHTTYFVNGVQVSKDNYKSYLTPSKAKSMGKSKPLFNKNVEDILSIGK